MNGYDILTTLQLGLLRPTASLASPAGKSARLSILIYHRVLEEPDPLRPDEVDAAVFRWQMALLARHFNVLPLSAAVERLRQGRLPARAACVTFDDGYADNARVALPILTELGVPATFFIASGYLNGGRMWNDTVIEALRRLPCGDHDLPGLGMRRLGSAPERGAVVEPLLARLKYLPFEEREAQARALAALAPSPLPDDLMMNSEQVRSLQAAGMEIGAHTVGHPILARMEPAAARRQIGEDKECLEALLNRRVTLFAYPNGRPSRDYGPEHVAMVRKLGFEAAVSTVWGAATITSDRWQLPRFRPWDATPPRFAARLVWNCRYTGPKSSADRTA